MYLNMKVDNVTFISQRSCFRTILCRPLPHQLHLGQRVVANAIFKKQLKLQCLCVLRSQGGRMVIEKEILRGSKSYLDSRASQGL